MTEQSATAAGPGVELHSIADRVEVSPGVMMPRLGFGTSHVTGARVVERVVLGALELGYRSIDTATAYGNESEIGAALKHAAVPRDELFVTTKVWPSDQGYEPTLRAFELSRSRLRLDYVDLYLIHWPESRLTAETWRAFEKLHERGLVRAIGVSNFMQGDFEQLLQTAKVTPAVNQIEFHPRLQRPELVGLCDALGVTVEAYSPLIRGKALTIPEVVEIGVRHGKTAAQVVLRWILQRGLVTIPKSTHERRLRENADIFDFALSPQEVATLDGLDRGEQMS